MCNFIKTGADPTRITDSTRSLIDAIIIKKGNLNII
jgi:hypothetical protein